MESGTHTFTALFAQLGLPADKASIDAFLRKHAPLAGHIALADAPFWSPSQAALLREQVAHDADWAEIVDELNLSLRAAP